MSNVRPIPAGVPVVMPMLVCRDVSAEIDFCKATFGAVELVRRPGPDGTVPHALVTIGPAMVLIEGEWPTLTSRAPQPDGSSPVVIYVYVEDVDAVVERAVAARARVLLPVKNQFWGDRTGRVVALQLRNGGARQPDVVPQNRGRSSPQCLPRDEPI